MFSYQGYFQKPPLILKKVKALNGCKWKGSIKFDQMLNTNAGLYAETLYLDEHVGLTAGVTYTF